ncbi:hypothetical protein NQD34_008299 [Periophthalmus magnuspinnatus]|nr:hypothetical protein NQD34_008299 [Periophthalmus magnuspinnatus]
MATLGVLGQSANPGISSRSERKRERRSFLRLRSRKLCALRLSVSSQSDDWGLDRWDGGRCFTGEVWDEDEGDEGEEGEAAEEVGEEALKSGDSDLTATEVT